MKKSGSPQIGNQPCFSEEPGTFTLPNSGGQLTFGKAGSLFKKKWNHGIKIKTKWMERPIWYFKGPTFQVRFPAWVDPFKGGGYLVVLFRLSWEKLSCCLRNWWNQAGHRFGLRPEGP